MHRSTGPFADAVLFSLKDGLIWAHLPTHPAPIVLGNSETVIYMMRDFLAQCELAERLGDPNCR
ncbi:hypothetical protein [Sphingobium sp. Cam5-1]|uniref:hypothetical protein n=1 Tax=Sphingobium sp. Cam5-1 TaxID=2789327 RepID=UPI0018AD2371|nr:hypothetical protein [Sphingobium sp. Cam5-1]QPI75378.1 hypothetical protein IZV00_19680 [Sphingobium sp. Cam5-1]